jgi:hypothetical protein
MLRHGLRSNLTFICWRQTFAAFQARSANERQFVRPLAALTRRARVSTVAPIPELAGERAHRYLTREKM